MPVADLKQKIIEHLDDADLPLRTECGDILI